MRGYVCVRACIHVCVLISYTHTGAYVRFSAEMYYHSHILCNSRILRTHMWLSGIAPVHVVLNPKP
jgi:hypothetical protein